MPFQRCITCPQNFKIAVVKQKGKICSRLVTVDHGGQKNRNDKRPRFFFTMFSTSDGSTFKLWHDFVHISMNLL